MDVLIVEDEKALRESLLDGLSSTFDDLEVRAAGSAEEARSVLESAKTRLVVTDVRLPGEDGIALVLDVAERTPETAFILMSAYPSPEARRHAGERGIRFLEKPFEFAELTRSVEAALQPAEFSGSVGGISLVDLLQVLNMGRRTAAVTLESGGRAGCIYLREGEVVHAEAGERSGREAFDELMTWQGGSFGSRPGRTPERTTITEPFNALLLDVFRVHDERAGTSGDDALDDALELSFGTDADGPPGADEAGPTAELLEHAVRAIPGCLAAGAVDLRREVLSAASPEDALRAELGAEVARAVAALMRHERLAALDRRLAGSSSSRPGDGEPLEVIVRSHGRLLLVQRVPPELSSALVVVCAGDANLGSVVARARSWRRHVEARPTP